MTVILASSPYNLGKREVFRLKAGERMVEMKYGDLTLGQIEAIVNRLGGMDGVRRFLAGFLVVVAAILRINRKRKFDPVEFIGEGWKIAEEDENSLKLEELEISKVQLETTLKKDETWVNGEEKQKRLKAAGHVRLDAAVFLSFWENQTVIPEEWKKYNAVYFDGTVLLGPDGSRFVCCTCIGAAFGGAGTTAGLTLTGTSTVPRPFSQVFSPLVLDFLSLPSNILPFAFRCFDDLQRVFVL